MLGDDASDEIGATDLPAELTDVVAALREPPPVRDAWRESVLRAVHTRARPVVRTRRETRVPSALVRVAVAAAAAGFLLGVGTMRLAQRTDAPTRLEPPVVAASDAPSPTLVRFVVLAPGAQRVALVGEFNGWDPAAMPMRRGAGGAWFLEAPLVPGRHRYAFLVDGRLVADPGAPAASDDDFGVRSSVILVTRPST